MKKLSFIILLIIFLTGCITFVPEDQLVEWALDNDYIRSENAPVITEPPIREPQLRPSIPEIRTTYEDGTQIPFTRGYLMEIATNLMGTIEKFELLAEVYETEYTGDIEDPSYEELRQRYLRSIENTQEIPIPPKPETDPISGLPSTGFSDGLISEDEFRDVIDNF